MVPFRLVVVVVQALQRELPRPVALESYQKADAKDSSNPALADASRMIHEEMMSILQHDNAKYPVVKVRKGPSSGNLPGTALVTLELDVLGCVLQDAKEDKKKKKESKKRKQETPAVSVRLEEFQESDMKSASELIR